MNCDTPPAADVGDLARFTVTISPPPSDPGAVSTAVQVVVLDPAGNQAAPVDCTNVSTNLWRFAATDRFDQPGHWTYRVNSNAGIIDSFEITIYVNETEFSPAFPA